MKGPGVLEGRAIAYGEIDHTLGQWENQKFLKDMKVSNREFIGDEVDEVYYLEVKRARAMFALRKLVACYVQEDLVESVFKFVLERYDAEWNRYQRDKDAGVVKAGTEDYREYSWRGNGPRPYFEGLIKEYFKKRRHRSIDDE